MLGMMLVGCTCRTEPPPEPPNVLIVLWDTVRADRMSLYGHDLPTTPHLDAFAKDAMVFDRAYAPGMWTLPTHASFFTGLPAQTHGASATYRWLDDRHVTLAERFGEAGWATYAFSSNLVAGQLMNVMQGFQTQAYTYRPPYAQAARSSTRAKLLPEDRSTEMSPGWVKGGERDQDFWEKAVYKDAAPLIGAELLKWIDGRAEEAGPFFAYVNFMEAHTPRIPSRSARERILEAERLQRGFEVDQSLFTEVAWMVGAHDYEPGDMDAIQGVYDATLLDLDDATHTLMNGLRYRGLLDNTIVVVLSDHGESLGEHRLLEHRYSVHEPLLRVPFLIRYPASVEAGRRTEPVSTQDLFATLLDLAGLPGSEDPGVRSVSVMAEDRPGQVHATMQDPYASTLCSVVLAHPERDYTPWLHTYDAMIEGDLKLVARGDGERALYDLAADPGENEDRSEAAIADTTRMAAHLSGWVEGLTAYDEGQRTEHDRRKAQSDPAVAGMLEALGYAEGEALEPGVSLVERCQAATRPTATKKKEGPRRQKRRR